MKWLQMLMTINFINAHAQPLLKFIIIHIISAISWPPPLISQLFFKHAGFLKAAPFLYRLTLEQQGDHVWGSYW